MALSQQELMEDIQAEIGEASSESVDLTANLTDVESCETMEDLKANLLEARKAAQTIISQINDQLARLS
jgi:uncharacterized phage infection (PIP) family protein YhgE